MTLTLAAPQKYALVIVHTKDGVFDREYRISSEEWTALSEKNAPPPPGIRPGEQWKVLAQDFEVGDCQAYPDGSLVIKTGERSENGRTRTQGLRFAAGEWSGIPPNVSVTDAALETLALEVRPTRILNGVMEGNT